MDNVEGIYLITFGDEIKNKEEGIVIQAYWW